MKEYQKHIMVCAGTGCTSSHSLEIIEQFNQQLAERNMSEEVRVVKTGCFGFCSNGPVIAVHPEGIFYIKVGPEDVEEIIEEHLIKGNIVQRLLITDEEKNTKLTTMEEIPFYKKQLRVALANCGFIDPENIQEYFQAEGYEALKTALTTMTREEVLDVVKASGLRGRGGGGFPTGLKWSFAKNNEAPKKYVVCNADEGDPGAFMDRSILEGDPHAVIEAMMIAGYVIGADEGYVYIRAEYPLAIVRLQIAINAARAHGLLGNNIFGTEFCFDVHIRYGAGAFVCGEETALLNSIEGKRGMPRLRPPFPAEKGLFGCPTVINNVETFANISVILRKGAEWFCTLGTEGSKGTKVFALGGNVRNVGLVEVPMGITLREIIYDIGGGIPDGKQFKAAQTGGPSGGCIPAEYLDIPIDFESLKNIGSMMGSGGLIVMDDTKCMVSIAKFFVEFMVEESCGKCTPCRIGCKRMYELLEKIVSGKATTKDLAELEEVAEITTKGSLCALGQTAANPVKSTLAYFRDEYMAHIVDKRCPAGECSALLRYYITDACIGCTACAKVCPVQCIKGKGKEKHEIIQSQCIQCGSCMNTCKFNAIVKQ